MDFTFIHAADLHIDSPLAALGRKNAEAAAFFAQASKNALRALITETIESQAAFLVISGDIFDGDWQDVSTGLFLLREFVRLEAAAIPVYMLRGNHDAESRISRSLKWPAGVHEFPIRKPGSFELPQLRTVLHGRGFPDRAVEADFVRGYPERREGWLNIGVLHTSLDGRSAHAPYAPCTVADLKLFGYDYWALGHVHEAEIVAREPWIVYPGNLQGRSIREAGAKGAMRVHVQDGRITREPERLELDAARWAHVQVALAGCVNLDEVYARMHEGLERAHRESGGKPLAARITLSGATALHERLLADRSSIDDEALGLAERVSAQCWIEKIRVDTRAPALEAPELETKALGLDALLDEAARDDEFAAQYAAAVSEISQKLPPELRDQFAQEIGQQDDKDIAGAGLQAAARHYLAGVLHRGVRS